MFPTVPQKSTAISADQPHDIGSLGGGMILGVAKPVIKLRGNAGEAAVVNCSEMLLNMAENRAVFDAARNKI